LAKTNADLMTQPACSRTVPAIFPLTVCALSCCADTNATNKPRTAMPSLTISSCLVKDRLRLYGINEEGSTLTIRSRLDADMEAVDEADAGCLDRLQRS